MKKALVASAVALALLAGVAGCVSQNETVSAGTATGQVAEIPARLPRSVLPDGYVISLKVDPSQARFSGHTEITVKVAETTRMIRLHGRDMNVRDAKVRTADGRELKAQWQNVSPTGLAELRTEDDIPAGRATLVFDYDAPFNRTNEGLYLTEYAGIPYAFTQFEDIDARRAFPSFDEPGFKATYDLSLIVRESDQAIGNMPVKSTESLGDGTKRVHFFETPRLSSYLVAFAVGPLDVVEGKTIPANSLRPYAVPLRGVAAKGEGAKLKFALEHAGKQVETLEQYFGIAYPFAKLDLLAVPDFNAGAMENPGAITFRDTLLLVEDNASIDRKRAELSVTSHELAHQWFGDLVTMPWWTDIWLNEAFASWMGNKAAQRAFPEYSFALDMPRAALGAMTADSLSGQREIRQTINRDEEIHQAFDGITYRKGGGVLDMFESFVGPEVFQRGVHNYLVKHSWDNATAEDFIAAVADAAGKPELKAAFMTYLTQSGVPLIDVKSQCAGQEMRLDLSQSRYLPLGSPGARERQWHVPFCATVYSDGKAEKSCALLTEKQQSVTVPVSSCPAVVMPNSDGAGYYRWSVAGDDWKSLIARLPSLPSREALSVADALSAGFRAGNVDEATYLHALKTVVKRSEREIVTKPFADVELMVNRLHRGAEADALRDTIAAIYRPVFKRLGWEERRDDDANARGLRADLAQFLALTLNQAPERSKLAAWGKRYAGFGGDGQLHLGVVPEAYAGTALIVAAQDVGKPFVEHLAALVAVTADGLQRSRLLYAIGQSRSSDAIDVAHTLFFADKMRTNERVMVLSGPFHEPSTEQAQLDWFIREFDAIKERMPAQSRPNLANYLADFCDAGSGERIGQFLEAKITGIVGAQLPIKNTRESIALCTALVAHAAK